MKESLNLLLIEDDEDDYFIALDVFEELPGTKVNVDWVQEYDTAFARLQGGDVDVCFVDYRIGGSTGLEFVRQVREAGMLTPLVLLTGVGQHDIDVAATEAGASDYIDKSELDARLVERTIRYSIAHSRSLRSLAEKSSLLETTLESASAGIAAFEANGTCAAHNSQFVAMLDKVCGRTDSEEPDATFCKRVSKEIESSQREAGGDRIEMTGACGTIYEISRSETPHGGHVYVSVDITQQKQAQEATLLAKRDAEAASRAKSSFFANVSHEFRTPLHAIIGFSDVILAQASADDLRDYAKTINDSGKNLLEIINTVILFSRIESGQHDFNFESIFDLEHFVRDSVKSLHKRMVQRHVSLDVSVDCGLVSLEADQMALRTMLLNLVANAVDFSPENGRVEIRIDRLDHGGVALKVADAGVGIEEDKLEKVLDPFYQVEDSLDRSHEGIGLGLPLVKMLAKAHGGQLTLQSQPGEGTRACVCLPAAIAEVAPMLEQLKA